MKKVGKKMIHKNTKFRWYGNPDDNNFIIQYNKSSDKFMVIRRSITDIVYGIEVYYRNTNNK